VFKGLVDATEKMTETNQMQPNATRLTVAGASILRFFGCQSQGLTKYKRTDKN
jgi:hypothetical protein